MGLVCLKESWSRWRSQIPIAPQEGAILGERVPILKYWHFLPWAVQKLLNRSICHLGCGLGCAEGSTSSIIFARWRQCALPCGYIGATWQTRLNHPSAAAMRSYVKLLWPLVCFKTPYGSYFPSIFKVLGNVVGQQLTGCSVTVISDISWWTLVVIICGRGLCFEFISVPWCLIAQHERHPANTWHSCC